MYISNEDLFWAYKEEKNLLESKRVYTMSAVTSLPKLDDIHASSSYSEKTPEITHFLLYFEFYKKPHGQLLYMANRKYSWQFLILL